MAVPNSNNARNWIIRHREPKSVLVGYGSGSTIAKLSLRNDLLTTGIGVKGRSSPLRKQRGLLTLHL